MKEAVIGLGTNLYDREGNLKKALGALRELPETTIEEISSIYETKPFETPDFQSNYLNCCAKIKTNLSPEMLLGACLGIEAAMGRVRLYKNAARIIDLDLLLYQNVSVFTKNLILPHPRIKERAFVMVPLSDLYKNKIALDFDFKSELSQVKSEDEVVLYKKNLNYF